MNKVSPVVAAYRSSRLQESSHPRHPKGSPLGGQFAPKGIAQTPLKLGETDDVQPIIKKLVAHHSLISLTKDQSQSLILDTLSLRESLLSAEQSIEKEFGSAAATTRHRLLERAFQSEKVNRPETVFEDEYPFDKINTLQELYDLAPERALSLLPNYAEQIEVSRTQKFGNRNELLDEGNRMMVEIENSIPDDHRKVLRRSNVDVVLNPSDGVRNTANYHPGENEIRMDENFLLQGRSDFFGVYVHESGHGIDFNFTEKRTPWSFSDPEAYLTFNQTSSVLKNNKDKAKTALEKVSQYLRATRNLQLEGVLNDYFGAITNNEVGHGHRDEYYAKNKANGPCETWANWFTLTATKDPTIIKTLEKLTPKLHKVYSDRLKQLAQ